MDGPKAKRQKLNDQVNNSSTDVIATLGHHSLDVHINNIVVEGEVEIAKDESAVPGGSNDIESNQRGSNTYLTFDINNIGDECEVQISEDEALGALIDVSNDGESSQRESNADPTFDINNIGVECEVQITEDESLGAVISVSNDGESSQRESNAENGTHSMTDKQLYEHYKQLCQKHSFKPPIPLNKFKKMNFRYVFNIKQNELQPGSRFFTNKELLTIPRKIDKPFCHPGPERKCELYHWYLADSIIQEVNLKCDTFPNFVVRWVGYEDRYNTVEPLAFVLHTAIYKLFKNPDIYTASRSNNSCLRRRTVAHSAESLQCNSILEIEPTKYERAINKLVSKLQVEERADRYDPVIGFFSRGGNLVLALNAQFEFIREVFIPLVKELNAPIVVDKHYIGTISGILQATTSLKKLQKCQNKLSVKTYIEEGIREAKKIHNSGPHYVCFFVPKNHDRSAKSDTKQLNLHMCVYTVRSNNKVKDAIYYNPSPPCYKTCLPTVLDELKLPIMQSVTNQFGIASDKDDCLFKCMCYIIGLATGERKFEPDYSQPSRKYGRFGVNKNKETYEVAKASEDSIRRHLKKIKRDKSIASREPNDNISLVVDLEIEKLEEIIDKENESVESVESVVAPALVELENIILKKIELSFIGRHFEGIHLNAAVRGHDNEASGCVADSNGLNLNEAAKTNEGSEQRNGAIVDAEQSHGGDDEGASGGVGVSEFPDAVESVYVVLPVQPDMFADENLAKLDLYLVNKYDELHKKYRKRGAKKLTTTMRNIVERIIDDRVLINYSFEGAGQKKGKFKKFTNIVNFIVDTSMDAFNDFNGDDDGFEKVSKEAVFDHFKSSFLKYSKQRSDQKK